MAAFSAIAEATPAAYEDLAADLPRDSEALLFRPANETPPPGWEVVSARPVLQMICQRDKLPPASERGPAIVELRAADVPEMLALVDAAKPGPFAVRTHELGTYVGIRDPQDGRLLAMGGQRFQLAAHVELSAIAVHPSVQGRGLGGSITARLARAVIARGMTPFLHVFPDNPALRLYQRLGFRTRTTLWVLWHRPRDPAG